MGVDPYVYPKTTVLINKLDYRSPEALQEAEDQFVYVRSREALPHGVFDYAHLQQIHYPLFQDVYSWAEKERTVSISKGGDLFALPAYIQQEMHRTLSRLKNDVRLRPGNRVPFALGIAEHFADVNAIHPFRGGNGRSSRAFFSLLAQAHGYALDWSQLNQQQWIETNRLSHQGSNDGLVAIFEAIIEPIQIALKCRWRLVKPTKRLTKLIRVARLAHDLSQPIWQIAQPMFASRAKLCAEIPNR